LVLVGDYWNYRLIKNLILPAESKCPSTVWLLLKVVYIIKC
jgi:hypothetical protein